MTGACRYPAHEPSRRDRRFLRSKGARVLATIFVALALGVTVAFAAEIADSPSSPATPRVAFATGNFEIANSSADGAIFTVDGASPGSSAGGQVTITNSGDIPGPITLSKSDIVDQPGPAGGLLSDIADVTVNDVTQPQAPIALYAGRLVAMPDLALGTFAPSEARAYAFTVSMPDDAGSNDINAYQSASLRLGYVWAGTADAPAEPPPPAQTPSDAEPVPDQTTTETATTPDDEPDAPADVSPAPGGGDSQPPPQDPAIAGPAGGASGAPDRSARGERTTRADRANRGRQDPKPSGSTASAGKDRQERSGLAKVFHALKRVATAAAEKGSFPLLLLLLIGAFFALQSWLDRRDPKLALAPVDAEPTRTFG